MPFFITGCATQNSLLKRTSRFDNSSDWKANRDLISFATPTSKTKTSHSRRGTNQVAQKSSEISTKESNRDLFKQVSYQTESAQQDAVQRLLQRDGNDQTSDQDKISRLLNRQETEDSNSEPANDVVETDNDNEVGDLVFNENESATSVDSAVATQGENINANALRVDQVLRSVSDTYPHIEVAIGEIEAAAGKVIESWGEFDTIASAHSISQPLGFYQTYRNGAGVTKPLYAGGEVYGTYRIGDGNFEPWFGERETNEGGELKAGFSLPLLKDRNIDKRRAKLLSAGALQKEVQADVEARILMFERFATQAYWDWVSAGLAVKVQEALVNLAKERVENIEVSIEAGNLERIAQFDNSLFIANREADLVKAKQYFRETAITLSMFYRDANGEPLLADVDRLPTVFPNAVALPDQQIFTDIMTALSVRPEFDAYLAAREAACIDVRYGENLMLPKFDIKGFAGQDLGGETSSKGDKTPFEFQVGAFYELPLERRKGIGVRQVAQSKIVQIDAKTQFLADKIRAEIQKSATALNAAYEQIQQRQIAVRQAKNSLEAFRVAFDAGEKTLLDLNFYETYVAEAELKLIDAQFNYFLYRAVYETAISGEGLAEFDGDPGTTTPQ
jgi:outer membrane protein TolC